MAQTWRLCDGAGLGKSLWDAKGLLKPAGEWEEGITKAAGKSRHGEGDAASVSLGTSKMLSSGLVSTGAAARASPGAPGSTWASRARALPATLSALYLLPRHVSSETRLDFGSGRVGTGVVQRDV